MTEEEEEEEEEEKNVHQDITRTQMDFDRFFYFDLEEKRDDFY